MFSVYFFLMHADLQKGFSFFFLVIRMIRSYLDEVEDSRLMSGIGDGVRTGISNL